MNTVTAIGVDLGGQSRKLGVVDDRGTLLLREQCPIDAGLPADAVTRRVLEAIRAVREQAASSGWSPRGVGMVMPGYMDRQRSRLTFAANLPALSWSTFLADIRAALDLSIEFDADSNAAAMAEHRYGAGRGVDRLIVVTVGTGIGAGVMIGGQIVRLLDHIAGSLGHVIVDARGPKCACGATGCVEALASGRRLEEVAEEYAARAPDSRLAALKRERGRLSGVEIREALDAADATAQRAVGDVGWWLGVGIASWSAVFAPQKVLIGGGMAALGEPLLDAVRKGLSDVGQPHLTGGVAVEPAHFGANAGIIGAATMVLPS